MRARARSTPSNNPDPAVATCNDANVFNILICYLLRM